MKGCEEVVHWYWVKVTVGYTCCTEAKYDYDSGSVCCIRNYYYYELQPFIEEVCTPDTPNEPDPNDNGGGENNNGLSTMDFERNGLSPCNSFAFDKIVSSGLPSQVIAIVSNFNVRKDLTIVLAEAFNPNYNEDGATTQLNANTYQITLNSNALNNATLGHATQEYIVATILHEVLHVYIGTGNDPDHEVMAQKYVIPMANALMSLGYNITNERAQALAWGGLQFTTAWKQLVDIDRVTGSTKVQDIININSYYKTGVAGVACP